MITDLEPFRVTLSTPVAEVIARVDRNLKGIALVMDEDGRLIDTVTDGDIRRTILASFDLNRSVGELLKDPRVKMVNKVRTATVHTPKAEIIRLMAETRLRQIPIVDENNKVLGLAVWSDLVVEQVTDMSVMIMAGGFGKRLRPLTNDVPKPMLPIGDRPILERIVEQLSKCGIRQVNLSTHYKSEVIEAHFGDGSKFGVDINYVTEDEPLGTAGALCMVDPGDKPMLLINGDILTSVDFSAMLDFHREHEADLTVAVKDYRIEVPYGVVKTRGAFVESVAEKPLIQHFINAGIYMLQPKVCALVPQGTRLDMTDLIEMLLKKGRRVVSFPIREYWLDIGRMDDYLQAQDDTEHDRVYNNGADDGRVEVPGPTR